MKTVGAVAVVVLMMFGWLLALYYFAMVGQCHRIDQARGVFVMEQTFSKCWSPRNWK